MENLRRFFERVRGSQNAAGLAALAGVLVYGVQAVIYAHQVPSTLDEGNYLYKGLLFARGIYTPFQEYGPWTNKMPLSFLIPGWGQVIFGEGLRSGRYFAIGLSLLMLLALWLVTRRLGGWWWAAFTVWALAANPGIIKMYSQALSEGVVAFLLAWVLVLLVGPGRKTWQLLAGAGLSALVVMTRQNMLPVVAFAVLYVAWEYGWRKGLVAGLCAGLVLAVFHAVYWPGILRLWTPWLPFKLPFLAQAGSQAARVVVTGGRLGEPVSIREVAVVAQAVPGLLGWLPLLFAGVFRSIYLQIGELLAGIYPIWDALRYYFVPVFGSLLALFLVPWRRADWKSASHYRVVVALGLLLLVLVVAHAWAAMGNDYCVYCFSIYMAFFSEIGFVLLAASAGAWRRQIPAASGVLAGLVILLFAAGSGLGGYPVLAGPLLTLQIPRVSNLRLQGGTTDLWRSLSNKFGLSFEALQRILPTLAGLAVGVLVLLLALLLARRLARQAGARWSASVVALLAFFMLGALLTPSAVFGNANDVDCGGDVIASYEAAGQLLSDELPAGALVYWRGGLSPVPLLYVPDIRIYPPQLNGGYSFSKNPDSDYVYRRGMWNAELQEKWLSEADYVLVEDRTYRGSFKDEIDPSQYNELTSTPPLVTCREGSKIRVFRREK